MMAYYLRSGGVLASLRAGWVLASLQAGACAVGGGLGSSTTSALRGAGAAVLSAHARPYSPEPDDKASHGSYDKAEFQELFQAVKGQAKQLEALTAGTTEYQKAQAKQVEALTAGTTEYQKAQAKQVEALTAGTTEYQKKQATNIDSLVEWRTTVLAFAKFTSFLVLAGGAYIKLFT